MTGKYATETTVPVSRTRDEIERTLERYGASAFGYDRKDNTVEIRFELPTRRGDGSMRVRMGMVLPTLERVRDQHPRTMTGRARSETSIEREWEQMVRHRWRALALLVKAKLEAIALGIITQEEAFLADIVVGADGETVGAQVVPLVREIVQGRRVDLLDAPPPPKVIELPSRTG